MKKNRLAMNGNHFVASPPPMFERTIVLLAKS
jgi:hypothetical protein